MTHLSPSHALKDRDINFLWFIEAEYLSQLSSLDNARRVPSSLEGSVTAEHNIT